MILLIWIVIGGVSLGIAYYRWVRTWEERVIKKFTKHYRGETGSTAHHMIYLRRNRGVITRGLGESDWGTIKMGDYVVKKKHSYQIEIRKQ